MQHPYGAIDQQLTIELGQRLRTTEPTTRTRGEDQPGDLHATVIPEPDDGGVRSAQQANRKARST